MKSILAAKEKIKPFQKAYPVKAVPIAKTVGLRVWRAKNWSNEVSGKIQKCEGKMAKFAGESGYAIFVNADHSETRRRFTIAHEIGHFLLHKDSIGDGIYDDAMYRSGLQNWQEAQANAFAADLLMPQHLLSEAMRDQYRSIAELAKLFNVSPQAMAIRMDKATAIRDGKVHD